MRTKIQHLNYNSSKVITDTAFNVIRNHIGPILTDTLFNNYVNGHTVGIGDDNFPVQWLDMISNDSIEEYLTIDGLEFRFFYEHMPYDAIIRLRLEKPIYFL